MDIPVVITDRLTAIEMGIDGYRRAIAALELERDSLRLTVDVLTKIPDGWKYVEGGAEVMVEREPIAVSASPSVLGSKVAAVVRADRSSGRRSKKQREILSVLRKLGPTNRHLVAGAIGMKPDLLSQHLSNMKKLKIVAHDPETGIWSAA